ncbi:MAG: NfeD family protein [Spirochaetia bacterium]|jgi:membrane protein implicated in regulation of membrane protease activity|nr:NfeD family protein [Spirochaetia bacterium]
MTPIIWLALGVVLMALEILLPGFVIFWFGLSGVITALLAYTGIISSPEYLWFFFFASSLVFLSLWFAVLRKRFSKEKDERDPTLLDLRGKCTAQIEKSRPGEVELYEAYHGITKWKAESSEIIELGDDVLVLEASGIKLIVKKI